MKIISIVGSPRGTTGNTAALLRIVLEGAESSGAKTETIAIKGSEVKPCRACDLCHKTGVCPQRDQFSAFKKKVMEADGLVLATPNYISHVSAQMKAFLDRCCGVVHCMGFQGKYGASVVTSGVGDEEPITRYLNQFLAITGCIPVGSVWSTMDAIEDHNFLEDTRKKAFALGEKLVAAWRNKETAHAYEPIASQARERMQSLLTWRKEEWPFEYQFWKECHGMK
ncbi:MAG TPA: flavodoxin family protein [Syntrophorhabdales bacterium]|nr:flavodoxin family protein [Syntrophorhabdales bacterium]